MAEAWGTLLIRKQEIYNTIDFSNIREAGKDFVALIFEQGGFNANALKRNPYTIEEVGIQGDYLELSVFGDDWMMFAESAMQTSRSLEVYGTIYDEYGTRIYFAKTVKGEAFAYAFEDDGGDACEQDDFDKAAYLEMLNKNEQGYFSLVPEALKQKVDCLTPVKPMFVEVE